jgi:hypothetical protein
VWVVQVDPDTAKKSSEFRIVRYPDTGTVLYRYTCAPRDAAGYVALRCRRLCSPPRFFALQALPVLAHNQLPALSVASPLVVSTTDREPFGCRRRGRAAKELVCHLGKNWQAVLLIILSFPPGQHIQVSVFLDRQREVLIKLVFVALERPRALSACSRRRASSMSKTRRPKRMGPSSTASLPPPTPSRDERGTH